MKNDFKTIDESVLVDGKSFSKCGICSRFMAFSEQAEMIKCEHCNLTLKMPRKPHPRLIPFYC